MRIHSRLPVVIPANRITDELCYARLQSIIAKNCILLTHINHANEIDLTSLKPKAMQKLKQAG